MDKIYTPPDLANLMARVACTNAVNRGNFIVADFAAGRGELLLAAARMWPEATVVATDVDDTTVRDLRKGHAAWQIGTCDFLNPRSRQNCGPLKNLAGRVGIVMLNPPFSCRGGTRVLASAGGVTLRCSLGLAFVMNSVEYLPSGGEIVAVLPAGSLTSEKDADAWALLQGLGLVEVVKSNGHRTFANSAVRTSVVHFTKQEHQPMAEFRPPSWDRRPQEFQQCDNAVCVVRGTAQMHKIQFAYDTTTAVSLIHTTNLREFRLTSCTPISTCIGRCVSGPMVLLPRVGLPNRSKIVKYLEGSAFMLSDCVIALKCDHLEGTGRLWQTLQDNWGLIEQQYVGSGAKYITIRRLMDVLHTIGYHPFIAEHNKLESL